MTGEQEPTAAGGGPARGPGLRWWRWFAVFWLALGIAGVGVRQWQVVALAGLFLTGCLTQEIRAVQRGQAPDAAPKAAILSVVTAGLGAGSVYLALRVTFHVLAPWWVVPVLLVALLVLYAAGPPLAARIRGRTAGDAAR